MEFVEYCVIVLFHSTPRVRFLHNVNHISRSVVVSRKNELHKNNIADYISHVRSCVCLFTVSILFLCQVFIPVRS